MKAILLLISLVATLCTPFTTTAQSSRPKMCPDGSYVDRGPCKLCPDNTYIGGGGRCKLTPNGGYVRQTPDAKQNPRLTPGGTYIESGRGRKLCPDGSYVAGKRCKLMPDGSYIGVDQAYQQLLPLLFGNGASSAQTTINVPSA